MSEVKRYDPQVSIYDLPMMEEDIHGNYVDFEDYIDLRSKCEELEKELEACTEIPGGCGYWREAARLREIERDEAIRKVEAHNIFRDAMERLFYGFISISDKKIKHELDALKVRLSIATSDPVSADPTSTPPNKL